MLPGEADAAVHLDEVARDLRVRRRAVHLGQAGGQRHVLAVGGERPQPVVSRRAGRLRLGQHVRAHVLDGLERADRPPELDPHPGVPGGHLHGPGSAADLLGGQQDGRGVEHPAEHPPAVSLVPDQPGRRPGELQVRLLAGLVEGGHGHPPKPRRGAVHREQADAGRRARADHDEIGDVAIKHVPLAAVQHPAAGITAGPRLHARLVPAAGLLQQGQRADGRAGGQAGQQVLPGRLVGAAEQGLGGQRHAGQVGRAQQRPAHLLEDDAELDVAEPGSLVLLGNGQPDQAELVAQLPPDRGVVASRGGHQPAHGLLGRLAGQEVAHGGPQFQLLVRAEEVHPASRLTAFYYSKIIQLVILSRKGACGLPRARLGRWAR